MNLVIKQRASLLEAVMAFKLLVTNYQKKGYMTSSFTLVNAYVICSRFCGYMIQATLFMFDPSRGQLVVAKSGKLVVGTMRAEFNPKRTPIEKTFPVEMKELRNSTQSFAYLGSFAAIPTDECKRPCLQIFRKLLNTLIENKIDVAICVVHPDHSTLYKLFGLTEKRSSKESLDGLDSEVKATLMFGNVKEIKRRTRRLTKNV